jgi:hypothetical protein
MIAPHYNFVGDILKAGQDTVDRAVSIVRNERKFDKEDERKLDTEDDRNMATPSVQAKDLYFCRATR